MLLNPGWRLPCFDSVGVWILMKICSDNFNQHAINIDAIHIQNARFATPLGVVVCKLGIANPL